MVGEIPLVAASESGKAQTPHLFILRKVKYKNMYYVYIIKSEKNNSYYIGSTNNLKKRFKEHNQGKSKYTSHLRPWKLIYYEAYSNLSLALNRECKLKKRAKSWQELCKRLGIKR